MSHRLFKHFDTVGFFARGEIPGVICFVPLAAMKNGRFDEATYSLLKYNSFNVLINIRAIGSHTFPSKAQLSNVLPPEEIDSFIALVKHHYGDDFEEQI